MADTDPLVFVSYRRGDATAMRFVHGKLRGELGDSRVFVDTERDPETGRPSIPPGDDWRPLLLERARCARVMLVIVARDFQRRLPDLRLEDDVVRAELRAALAAGVIVLPVVLDGVQMPAASDLPDDLRALSDKQASHVRADTAEADVQDVVGDVCRLLGYPTRALGREGRDRLHDYAVRALRAQSEGCVSDAASDAVTALDLVLRAIPGLPRRESDGPGNVLDHALRRGAIGADLGEPLGDLVRSRDRLRGRSRQDEGREVDCVEEGLRALVSLGDRLGVLDVRRVERDVACPQPDVELDAEVAVHLDRAPQKERIRLLRVAGPALLYMVQGETGQGHEHFTEWVRSELHVRAQTRAVRWPPPHPVVGHRLATLLEEVATVLGVDVETRRDSSVHPVGEQGERAWAPLLEGIRHAIVRHATPRLYRHVSYEPVATDAELIASYVQLLWRGLVLQPRSAVVVVSFEVVREPVGWFPWLGRGARQKRAAMRIANAAPLPVATLPELASVTPDDLAPLLVHRCKLPPPDALGRARAIVARAHRGRFEPAVMELQSELRRHSR